MTRPDAVTAASSTPDEAPAVAALAALAAFVTIALTATAFWLSYEHLHDVAARYGLQAAEARAWAWPATVDLFIVAGEVLILRASLLRRVDPWAIALTAAGSLGSIALNVAGVGTGARPLDYVVAAVPPIAALLAFGALMRQVHDRIAALATAPATAPSAPDDEDPVYLSSPADEQPQADEPATEPAEDDEQPAERPTYELPIDELIRCLYDIHQGRPTTGQMTAAMSEAGLGDAPSTARASRARIEAREPRLRDLPSRVAS
ncbi:DUF2637 domain-containing protein [Streptomyces sp. NRRL B-24484]|uniref:DUF2637 domain-containing protein n=1 Tax=Streptomyces sp. NRRL B-24484 TaxID=1463833 RepID=UPI000AB13102